MEDALKLSLVLFKFQFFDIITLKCSYFCAIVWDASYTWLSKPFHLHMLRQLYEEATSFY